ncbi:MAG TPA: hypothetical protein VGC14_20830 [Rhizobium sp.]
MYLFIMEVKLNLVSVAATIFGCLLSLSISHLVRIPSHCWSSWIGGFARKAGLFGRFSPRFGGFFCSIEWNGVHSNRQLEALPPCVNAETDGPVLDHSQNSQFRGISAVEGR